MPLRAERDHSVPPQGQAGGATSMADEGWRPGLQSPDASTRAMCMSPSMRSPGGGASHSPSMLPPCMWPPHNVQGSPGAYAPLHANAPHTDIQLYIAHMREHEYPSYMRYYMSQGIPQQQAHSMYTEYESMRVAQRMGGAAPGRTMGGPG